MTKQIRILVVDDFEIVRVSIRSALKQLGFPNVQEAEDGRVALEKIEGAYEAKAPFDVVFCDWNMPEVSGLQVIEKCRASELFRDLPIVMVTAEGDKESVVKALKAGASDYILKPVVPAMLEKRMKKIMEKVNSEAA